MLPALKVCVLVEIPTAAVVVLSKATEVPIPFAVDEPSQVPQTEANTASS